MSCRHPLVVVTLRELTRRLQADERSRYSEVLCLYCGLIYRTDARRLETAPDAPAGWELAELEAIRQAVQGTGKDKP